jgi:glycosyltransferase involved in cell wall biosynthesis
MHLLIIGHTAHYRRDGRIYGWGPTVKEINWLARAFDKVTHVASFYPGPTPKSALPYDTDKVRFVGVPPAGGRTWREKARVILYAPKHILAILRNLGGADVIHVRCPGSLGMYGIIVLFFVGRKLRWVKYGGNWVEPGIAPISFAFQRWWLRQGLSRGPVTVNGKWENQPNHVFSFLNPSMTLEDTQVARDQALDKRMEKPVHFVFAGRTATAKGLGRSLEIVKGVTQYSGDVHFDILGDGPERRKFEQMTSELGLTEKVTFRGWVPHDQIPDYLAKSHFMLLPSDTEGWPKVLSEAMSYGVVPVASNVSAIPQILDQTKAGLALPADDVDGAIRAIVDMMKDPPKWKKMSLAGIEAAPHFTYERYLTVLDDMFNSAYGHSPLRQDVVMELRQRMEAVQNGPSLGRQQKGLSGVA